MKSPWLNTKQSPRDGVDLKVIVKGFVKGLERARMLISCMWACTWFLHISLISPNKTTSWGTYGDIITDLICISLSQSVVAFSHNAQGLRNIEMLPKPCKNASAISQSSQMTSFFACMSDLTLFIRIDHHDPQEMDRLKATKNRTSNSGCNIKTPTINPEDPGALHNLLFSVFFAVSTSTFLVEAGCRSVNQSSGRNAQAIL